MAHPSVHQQLLSCKQLRLQPAARWTRPCPLPDVHYGWSAVPSPATSPRPPPANRSVRAQKLAREKCLWSYAVSQLAAKHCTRKTQPSESQISPAPFAPADLLSSALRSELKRVGQISATPPSNSCVSDKRLVMISMWTEGPPPSSYSRPTASTGQCATCCWRAELQRSVSCCSTGPHWHGGRGELFNVWRPFIWSSSSSTAQFTGKNKVFNWTSWKRTEKPFILSTARHGMALQTER